MTHKTTTLHITEVDEKVTEKMLKDIFNMISPVHNVKINTMTGSALVEFNERQGAEQALHTMDGRTILGKKIKIHWWKNQPIKHSYHVLVSWPKSDMQYDTLKEAFDIYHPTHIEIVSEKNYAIVDFDNLQDAEKAIKNMDGKSINKNTTVFCTWSSNSIMDLQLQSVQTISRSSSPSFASSSPLNHCHVTSNNMSYEEIFCQTPPYVTTVNITNLPENLSEQALVPHFQQYGYVTYVHKNKDGVTISLDTHGNAATAIFALQGFKLEGNSLELTWGTNPDAQQLQHANHHSQFNYLSCSPSSNGSSFMTSSLPITMKNKPTFQPLYGGHHYNMFTMLPPAPVSGSPRSSMGKPGQGVHAWNQYYQNYYSAGHQNI
ncbi:unnamed protein product [Cunninghamella blakesleeana]